jgi:hypothetical protein
MYNTLLEVWKIFLGKNQNLPVKKQYSDKDEEIRHHQPSSPTTTSRCPVTQMLPLTIVAVTVVVAWQRQG